MVITSMRKTSKRLSTGQPQQDGRIPSRHFVGIAQRRRMAIIVGTAAPGRRSLDITRMVVRRHGWYRRCRGGNDPVKILTSSVGGVGGSQDATAQESAQVTSPSALSAPGLACQQVPARSANMRAASVDRSAATAAGGRHDEAAQDSGAQPRSYHRKRHLSQWCRTAGRRQSARRHGGMNVRRYWRPLGIEGEVE